MNLPAIPPVVFAHIVPFLRISDICCLYLTGDRRIIHAMSDSREIKVLKFYLDEDPSVNCMPNFARLFPNLKRLSITRPSPHAVISTISTPLTHLPPTLEFIELSFYSARDWFFHLPHAEGHSHLVSGQSQSKQVFKQRLPNDPPRAGLFPHLADLKLSGGSHCGCWSSLEFAPNLQSLYLENTTGLEKRHLADLPASLTSLQMPANSSLRPPDFSALPRQLRVLELSRWSFDKMHQYVGQHQSIFESLPMLTTMKLDLPSTAATDLLSFLPRTLTNITLTGTYKMSQEPLQSLPKSLVSFNSDGTPIRPTLLQYIPERLEHFHTLIIDVNGLGAEEYNLDLPIPSPLPNPVCLRLLKSLSIRSHSSGHALRTLRILSSITFPSLELFRSDSPLYGDIIPFVHSLPSTMKVLNLILDSASLENEFSQLSDQESSLEFPEHLTELSIKIISARIGDNHVIPVTRVFSRFDVLVRSGKIQWLPSSLKRFCLLGTVISYGELIRLLPHSLDSVALSSVKANDDISWFADLPRRLRSFSFENFQGSITADHLKSLPQSLLELFFLKVSGIEAKDLGSLPRSITSLSMSAVKLQNSDLKLLPDSLISFNGPFTTSSELRRMLLSRALKRT